MKKILLFALTAVTVLALTSCSMSGIGSEISKEVSDSVVAEVEEKFGTIDELFDYDNTRKVSVDIFDSEHQLTNTINDSTIMQEIDKSDDNNQWKYVGIYDNSFNLVDKNTFSISAEPNGVLDNKEKYVDLFELVTFENSNTILLKPILDLPNVASFAEGYTNMAFDVPQSLIDYLDSLV